MCNDVFLSSLFKLVSFLDIAPARELTTFPLLFLVQMITFFGAFVFKFIKHFHNQHMSLAVDNTFVPILREMFCYQ